MIELAMRLVQIMAIKLPSENVYSEHPADLSMVVSLQALSPSDRVFWCSYWRLNLRHTLRFHLH